MSGPTPAGHELRALAREIAGCLRCAELAPARQHTVPGQFPEGARLLLVGEGPGADEDAQGEPFVGRSGQLLDTLLADAGLARSQVAVANVLKCRPPGNRAPKASEVAACRPYLQQQLDAAAPALVVALGSTATSWFFGRGARLTALRGTVHEVAGRHVLPTYHPSAALRFGPRGEPARALQEDLRLAEKWLGAAARSASRVSDGDAAVHVADAAAMQDLGAEVAATLRAGDLVIISGPLGAGKTTFVQGMARGLQVRGAVTSPTFVIARIHRSTAGGPDLVHVDAYRLHSFAEVDDLDLDASIEHSVTVVEWGEGKVEGLVDRHVEVRIARDADDGEVRRVTIQRDVGSSGGASR